MIITEKVSPSHPDKIADRIAGALVDYCYNQDDNARCAFEVLVGHNSCFITAETSVHLLQNKVWDIADRIAGVQFTRFEYVEVPQDVFLADNQRELRCGDNGVFAGFVMPDVHKKALDICQRLYERFATDGKIVLNEDTHELTICWSKASEEQIREIVPEATKINPLGAWLGGVNVDTGVTGRKLASDFYGIEYPLGGGTIHGKDLSKADCSVNIYCYLKAQETREAQKAICSIGDKFVNVNGELIAFEEIVRVAKEYIQKLGGFEKLAEWGLK